MDTTAAAMRAAYDAIQAARARGTDGDWTRLRLAVLRYGAACEERGAARTRTVAA
jgi:hypothetical protein